MNDDASTKTDKIREKELFKAIGSTPHGRELIEIWTRMLTRVKSFQPEQSEAHCRYVSGRHSVMIDFIKSNSEK